MADMPWEHADEARAALNAIVTDPEHGVAALSSPRTMSNLLRDLLPDAPREKNLLVAAAEAGLADTLREHVAQGMDSSTAIRLTASSFSARSPLTPDACSWVTSEIAVALGISKTNDAVLGSATPEPGPFGAATEVSPGLAGYPPGQGSSAEQPGRTFAQDGFAAAQDSYGRAGDSAPSAGGYQGPAVISPGQGGPASYPPASPTYPQAGGASQPPGQAGYQAGNAPVSPPYPPPTAFPPAQNPHAYGPGVGPGMPAMPTYQPVPRPGAGRRSNAMAVTSLVLGFAQVVGWILFILPGLLAAILAIVLGFVSMRQIRRSGESGKGLAITGVILGFLGILVVGILVAVGLMANSHS